MIARALAWYARRIVNVNINIIAAGVLALVPVLLVVRVVEWALSTGLVDGQRLHLSDKLIIGGATFVSDIIFDVVIYYGLHWAANHAPWLKKHRLDRINAVADAAVQETPFFKDATKVQLQRAVISPLLYVLWLGTQQALMLTFHLSAVWATVIGFCVGMTAARTIHTLWMLKHERAERERTQCAVCRRCGFDLRAMPVDSPRLCPECGLAFELVRSTPAELAGEVARSEPPRAA
jgi:hypothetical protein